MTLSNISDHLTQPVDFMPEQKKSSSVDEMPILHVLKVKEPQQWVLALKRMVSAKVALERHKDYRAGSRADTVPRAWQWDVSAWVRTFVPVMVPIPHD